jgi:two-component system, NtrC family, response regulator AtoC
MRPLVDEHTGTHKGAIPVPSHPHVVAMWPGGTVAKELPHSGRLTVGRSPTCDVSIQHNSVSREHAALYGGFPVELEDLGSTNGTVVGGRRIPTLTRVAIEPGVAISIGAAILVVHGAFESRSRDAGQPAPRGRRDERAPIVADQAMRELYRVVNLVARGDLSVILLGETGTGKDVLADAIHQRSSRASAAYVRLNCGALPDALLESELFGYERGAFTGAVRPKPGLFEVADGGTVFLDEIAEMPVSTQVKLLRVLENREITRLGGVRPRRVDVRIVCATNRDLLSRIDAGEFRQDLYFRLNGITLTIPPLRERRAEVAPLAREFVERACQRVGRAPLAIGEKAVAFLEGHSWRGNVRELKNMVERAVTLSSGEAIDVQDLVPQGGPGVGPVDRGRSPGRERLPATFDPESVGNGDGVADVGLQDDARLATRAVERRRISEAMSQCGGNQTRAAKLLQISRRTLVSRLTEFGFARPLKDRA